MAEDEGTKPFPSQNDLTGFTTVENPAPGTKMDVYVTRSLTNLDELLGLRQNFIYPQDLEFVMLADDRKRIKDVFDWATQLSNPSRSIDSTTSDAENNELCQENMPARNDYLQHIASPERNCYTAFSNSEIRQLLDWCCPGWNDMTWKQPCTAPLTKKPLQTAPLGIRQALVCTELLRYFSKEKQKAVLFYWHSGAFIFWLVVHEDVGVMQLPDFDQNHFGLFSNYEFYQDMSETLQGLLNRWNWRTDFFELTFDEKTAKNELTGFGIFEDLKRYYLPLGSKFEDIVLEIFTTLLSTRVVPTFSVKPYSNSQIKRGTEKYNRQENRLKLKEQDPSVKMNDLFPDWSKLEAITCYVYPPVYVPHYQGPTTKRMEDYKTWKTNLQARNEINPVPRYTKYLGPTKTQTKKNKAKEANAEAQNDEGKAEQTQLEHYEVQARGASGEYHAFDALKRAFARLKEKAFIVLHWKFENYNKELHKLPDVDILVIHASRGPALFEVKTIQSYDEMSNQAKRKKLDDISRTGCLKSNELRDAFQTCFLIEGQYKYITSFICFPLLKFPSDFIPVWGYHHLLDETWFEKLKNEPFRLNDVWPPLEAQTEAFEIYISTVKKIVQPEISGYSILKDYEVLERATQLVGLMPPPPEVFKSPSCTKKLRGQRPILFLNPEQEEAWYGSKQQLICGPPGTGKTILLQYKCLELLQKNENQKAIILAPPNLSILYRTFLNDHFTAAQRYLVLAVSMDDPFLCASRQMINKFLPCHVFIDEAQLCFSGMAKEMHLMWEYSKRTFGTVQTNKIHTATEDSPSTSQTVAMPKESVLTCAGVEELHFWAAVLPGNNTGGLEDTLLCTHLKVSLRTARNLQSCFTRGDSSQIFDLNVYGELLDGQYIVQPPGKDITSLLRDFVMRSVQRFTLLGIDEGDIAVMSSASLIITTNLEAQLQPDLPRLKFFTGEYDFVTPSLQPDLPSQKSYAGGHDIAAPALHPQNLTNTHDTHSLEFQAAIVICDPGSRNMAYTTSDATALARSRGIIGLSNLMCLPVYDQVFIKRHQPADSLIYESVTSFGVPYIQHDNKKKYPCILLLSETFSDANVVSLNELEVLNNRNKRFHKIRYAKCTQQEITDEMLPDGVHFVFVFPYKITLSPYDLQTLDTPGIQVRCICVVFNDTGEWERTDPYEGKVPEFDI